MPFRNACFSPFLSQNNLNQSLFPTTLVAIAFGVSVAIIRVGLLVYFKKRKR